MNHWINERLYAKYPRNFWLMCGLIYGLQLGDFAFAQAPRPSNPPATFTDQSKLNFKDDSLMIVTHASNMWDSMEHAELGINFNVMAFRQVLQIPVVYLQHATDSSSYYYSDFHPDAYVQSAGGEFSFHFDATTVYTQGGYMEQCQEHTVHDVLAYWDSNAQFKNKNLRLVYLSDGIYGDFHEIPANAVYYQSLIQYKTISGANVITLAELMRLLGGSANQSDFVKTYFGTSDGIGNYLDSFAKDRKITVAYGNGRASEPDDILYTRDPIQNDSGHSLLIQIIKGSSQTIQRN